MIFSRRTLVEAFENYNFKTHNEINLFALKYDLEKFIGEGSIDSKKIIMLRKILDNYLSNDDLFEIIERIVSDLFKKIEEFSFDTFDTEYKYLSNYLNLDGYTVEDGKLIKLYESTTVTSINQLEELFETHYKILPITYKHYNNALTHFKDGLWESSNGELRKMLESLWEEMYICISKNPTHTLTNENIRQFLSTTTPPILDVNDNLYGNNGKNFSNGMYKLLSSPGTGHAGISSKEKATMIMHIALPFTLYQLSIFDSNFI